MKYQDMSVFEIAAMLQELCLDIHAGFGVTVNGVTMSCYCVNVNAGSIKLVIEDEAIEIKEIKDDENHDNA